MMHSKPPVTKHSEYGMSLISLIIGILLSSISMLAAIQMHTGHQAAVSELKNSITHNRLLITALNLIRKEIHSAGYGIVDADEKHIVTIFDAGSSSNPAITSILWRYIDNEGTQCRGIIERGFIIDGIETRSLNLVQATACPESNSLESLVWNKTLGHLGQWEVKNQLLPYISANQTLFSFALETRDCSAPGMTQSAAHLAATISAPNSAILNGHTIPMDGFNVCLINTHPG